MTNALKIIPLSGLGEIGKNMTVLEYGRDMLIVDCGVKFPDDDMYGIDLVLPQFDYVVQNRAHLRGIVLTHGHLDHIGGLSYLLRQVSTTVYGTALTIGMVKRQLQEANALGGSRLQILQDNERFTLGAFKINPFPVAHSIPGSVGLVIDTPVGSVVHTGDYKLDETPTGGRTTDLKRLRALTPKGVLALLGDSTNADKPGTTPTEQLVAHELDRLFAEARHGRIIIATFGSLLARLREVMALALKHGRKVALTGRSLEQNVDLARELGYIKVPDDLIVPADANIPDDRILILSTGSQGEPRSALNRMATGQHRQVQVKHGDTIIVSGGTIPGNEGDVSRMLDRLFERGANVIYGRLANVHVSGHGSRDEMLAMLKATKPKFLIPVHGEVRHLHLHARLAEAHGMRSDHVFILENGAVLATDGKRAWREQPVPANDVLVDGRLIGEIGEPEMRDRQRLSEDGFIVAMIPVDAQDRLNGEPELISRGFLPAGRAADLIAAARREIRRQHSQGPVRQEAIQTTLQGFFFRETQSRPVVLTSLTRFSGAAAPQPGQSAVAQMGRGGQRRPQEGQATQRRGQEGRGQSGHASTTRATDGRRPERAGGAARTGAGGPGAHKGRPQSE
ncbi:MAG TPA: ribonuclease J, partial [Anaerolineales bacterium]|nr:ribonuclease J [Anaerolineales bacterium]